MARVERLERAGMRTGLFAARASTVANLRSTALAAPHNDAFPGRSNELSAASLGARGDPPWPEPDRRRRGAAHLPARRQPPDPRTRGGTGDPDLPSLGQAPDRAYAARQD